MSITDERIEEIAVDAVKEALRDLVHDRMGQGDLLSDYLPKNASEAEVEAACDRLEAEFKRHLAHYEAEADEEDDGAPDVHCTVCGGVVLCTDGDWWHERDAQDLDHEASPPDNDEQ